MTVVEVSMPDGISSSSTQTTSVADPHKSRTTRRRRMEIQRLKSSFKETKQNDDVSRTDTCCGAVSVMGRRREMEDTVTVKKGFTFTELVEFKKKYDYYGVYDGHGGSYVAEACKDRMHAILLEEIQKSDTWRNQDGCDDQEIDWEVLMSKCFEKMDEEVGGGENNVEEMTVGSTVVVAVVGDEEVVVANCGDSRAVISRNGVAVPLSVDHKVNMFLFLVDYFFSIHMSHEGRNKGGGFESNL